MGMGPPCGRDPVVLPGSLVVAPLESVERRSDVGSRLVEHQVGLLEQRGDGRVVELDDGVPWKLVEPVDQVAHLLDDGLVESGGFDHLDRTTQAVECIGQDGPVSDGDRPLDLLTSRSSGEKAANQRSGMANGDVRMWLLTPG